MKTLKLLALAATLSMSCAALADVEEKREMKLVVETAPVDGDAGFTWISDDAGFDLENMQVGETQSIVDESGRSVLITRETDGFRFNIDGETIVMPDMGQHAATVAMFDGSDMSADVDIEIIGGSHAIPTAIGGPGGVTIITGDALDASTQESIKAVLQSVGRGEDVTFIDNSDGGNGRHVSIVRKKIEVVQ